MKLWKYIHVSEDGKTVPINRSYKTPFVWAAVSPDEDYIEVTGVEYQSKLVSIEKSGYLERENQGKDYARYMDARLIVLGKSIPDEYISELVRSKIDGMFKQTRFYLSVGRWFSAKREIEIVEPNQSLESLIINYSLPINQHGLIQEIKDRIELAINELY